ncbi:hypothetical protein [Nocardia sp. CA-119907]|uniref:hypothetical protein n=1 Tax=Nocardia sp. CA-119907 TaxID=3239973 RepID=UPI003D99B2F9
MPRIRGIGRAIAGCWAAVPSVTGTPIIRDVEAGGDPDDAVTVVYAAQLPELVLVVTNDEIGGERACSEAGLMLHREMAEHRT